MRITSNNGRPPADLLLVGAGTAGLTTKAGAARDAANIVLMQRAPVWAVLRSSRITSGQHRRSTTGRRPVNPTGPLVGDAMTYRDWIISADAAGFEPASTYEACSRRGGGAGANDVRQGSQRGGASRQSVSTGGTWHAYRKH